MTLEISIFILFIWAVIGGCMFGDAVGHLHRIDRFSLFNIRHLLLLLLSGPLAIALTFAYNSGLLLSIIAGWIINKLIGEYDE